MQGSVLLFDIGGYQIFLDGLRRDMPEGRIIDGRFACEKIRLAYWGEYGIGSMEWSGRCLICRLVPGLPGWANGMAGIIPMILQAFPESI